MRQMRGILDETTVSPNNFGCAAEKKKRGSVRKLSQGAKRTLGNKVKSMAITLPNYRKSVCMVAN